MGQFNIKYPKVNINVDAAVIQELSSLILFSAIAGEMEVLQLKE